MRTKLALPAVTTLGRSGGGGGRCSEVDRVILDANSKSGSVASSTASIHHKHVPFSGVTLLPVFTQGNTTPGLHQDTPPPPATCQKPPSHVRCAPRVGAQAQEASHGRRGDGRRRAHEGNGRACRCEAGWRTNGVRVTCSSVHKGALGHLVMLFCCSGFVLCVGGWGVSMAWAGV